MVDRHLANTGVSADENSAGMERVNRKADMVR